MPFGGGTESPLNLPGSPRGALWSDSVTVAYASPTPTGLHVGLVDVRTGPVPGGIDLPDSLARGVTHLADGWAWIPATGDRVIVERAGRQVEIPKLKWFGELTGVDVDPSGQHLVFSGWNTGTNDSIGVAVVSVDGGTPVMWTSTYAEGGGTRFLSDGSVLFQFRPTQESVALLQVRGPGNLTRLGTLPRPVEGVSVSDDLKRVTVLESTYHGDAWMSRIVRP